MTAVFAAGPPKTSPEALDPSFIHVVANSGRQFAYAAAINCITMKGKV
jgi:hypothetical protein